MNQHTPHRLTVEQFIAWAQVQPRGRYELENGRIIEMAPERVLHIKVKFLVALALTEASKRCTQSPHVLTDGATVRIDNDIAYEPDALVYVGAEWPGDTIEIPNPMIVVEVVSPTSVARDTATKLANYFKVGSIQSYLIVDPDSRTVVHHRRGSGAALVTEIIAEGRIEIDPPGLVVQLSDLFPTA